MMFPLQLGVAAASCPDLWPGLAMSPQSFTGGGGWWKAVVFRNLLRRPISWSRVWRIALWSAGTSLVWPAVGRVSQLELALSAVTWKDIVNKEEHFRPAI